MLGSKAVYEFDGRGKRRSDENLANDACRDFCKMSRKRKLGELRLKFSLNLASELDGGGDEERAGIASVFGLRQQIGGDPASVAASSEDDRLGRAGGKIDAAVAETSCFAAVTKLLPGPKIFSTAGIDFVP